MNRVSPVILFKLESDHALRIEKRIGASFVGAWGAWILIHPHRLTEGPGYFSEALFIVGLLIFLRANFKLRTSARRNAAEATENP